MKMDSWTDSPDWTTSVLKYDHFIPLHSKAVSDRLNGNLSENTTSHLRNASNVDELPYSGSVETVIVAITLGIFILVTIIGNFFVIYAIVTEKNLKGIANKLILSLAVADLMVAILVLPLSAYDEAYKKVWRLGPELCQMWTSFDVLCCTSSILHLLAIAVDRYWAVTNLEYARNRQPLRIYLLIGGVWAGSFVISFAPLFGWKDSEFYERLEREKRCLISQDMMYQVFATFASFYIPLIFILILYWNIFKQARKRIRHKPGTNAVIIMEKKEVEQKPAEDKSPLNETQDSVSENGFSTNPAAVGRLLVLAKREKKIVKETTESKRERKAAKTLMIITGAFVMCWLPFFVMALLMAVCRSCEPSSPVFSIMQWLGYANSLLNPIIYTVFSPDFKNAFKRILCGAHSTTQRH